MTQEEKSLLLKDLCARLPYEVKISLNSYPKPATLHSITPNHSSYFKIEEIGYDFRTWEEDIKPYLRPMSSMTDEEAEGFRLDFHYDFYIGRGYSLNNNDGSYMMPMFVMRDYFDWLNSHHFDYRGLIEKGLAIEVAEGMYK